MQVSLDFEIDTFVQSRSFRYIVNTKCNSFPQIFWDRCPDYACLTDFEVDTFFHSPSFWFMDILSDFFLQIVFGIDIFIMHVSLTMEIDTLC